MDPRACELRGREPKGGHCDRSCDRNPWAPGEGGQLGGSNLIKLTCKARSNHPAAEPNLDPTPTKANAG